MRILICFLAAVFVTPLPLVAQIEMDTDGNVGVGDDPSASTKLRAECSMSTNCGAGAPSMYGVFGRGEGGAVGVGVYGVGVGGNVAYGIRGYATGGSTNWAGYFAGNVYSTGSYQGSDAKLKSNISALDAQTVLAALMQLLPRRFDYISTEELSSRGLPSLELPKGEHFGLIAQEVEKVYPEIVVDVAHPSEDGTGVTYTKAVNYTELVPILIRAIQAQQAQIEAMKAVLEAHGIVVE